jgi:hypothetical protein
MSGSTMRTTRAAGLAVAGALILGSCGAAEQAAAPSPSPSPSVSPSPSSTVEVPSGVELTDVGAELTFGDTATVLFEPNRKRGTTLELTVEKAVRGNLKDFSGFILDDYTRAAAPYYVDVTVTNVGDGQVGGSAVPLWGVDGENTLLPAASFTTPFRPCPSPPLPKKFGPQKSIETCLVFLAPDKGTLEAVSFRPNQEFDPIRWTGQVATPEPEPKKQERKQGKKQEQKQGKKRRR